MNAHVQPATLTAIDPNTQVGFVSLAIADLDRSTTFYTDLLGFAVMQQDGQTTTLGVAGTPLLVLTEHQAAQPWPVYATGLYHFAVLVPTRRDLGRSLRHLLERGFPMPGQADHLVSEALYLSDPDGNGIEIYRDRPRSEWQWDGSTVRMAVDPLDIRGLLAEAASDNQAWSGLSAGTRIGHIHLQVADLIQTRSFYHDVLGFDIVAQMPGALFVSAGGYHHHIGLNTWQSRGAAPAPANTAGLRFFTIEMPSEAARVQVVERIAAAGIAYVADQNVVIVRDPWQNTIVLHNGAIHDAQGAQALAAQLAVN